MASKKKASKKPRKGDGAKGLGAADANVHEVATDATPPRVKKILVYMATSTPKLVDPARAAQVALRGALERALSEDRATDDFFGKRERRIEVSMLVHGYQVDTGSDQGATEFSYTVEATDGGAGALNWRWGQPSVFSFIPGDPSVLTPWIRQKLESTSGLTDSVALILWGHGQGIGTDLLLPRPADAPPGIARPSFINIGGFGDRALARAIKQALPTDDRGGLIDLLVFDSCLMAGVELAYEFRDVARYLIASQSFVNTAPGGAPGLNLGAVVSAFVQPDAWPRAGVARGQVVAGRLLEASADIANLIGDARSGAQQLTLFQLGALDDDPCNGDTDDLVSFLEKLTEETSGQRREKLLAERVGRRVQSSRIRVAGLMKMFARVLQEASTNAVERERILYAVRGASFAQARQFLDLREVARRIHRFSRHSLLQLLALALKNEIEPQPDGFIVFHRAALPFRDKPRFGGVAIYCPWFGAQPAVDGDPIFDVVVDHDEYQFLAFNQVSTWSSFALGPLYEATASERKLRQTPDAAQKPRYWPGWGGHWPYPPYPYGPCPPYPPYPYGFLGDKPDASLGGGNKPDPSLGPGDKPDAPLGPRDDDDYV